MFRLALACALLALPATAQQAETPAPTPPEAATPAPPPPPVTPAQGSDCGQAKQVTS